MGIAPSSALPVKPGVIVTLDALGTIYKFREPIARQYINVAKRCGLKEEIKESELKQAFRDSYKEISKEYPNYGKGQLQSPRAWWKTLVNDTFRQVVDDSKIPQNLAEEMYDHFTSSAAYELYPDVKPFINSMKELKSKFPSLEDPPVFVGVISNGDPRVKGILESLGLRAGLSSMPSTLGFADQMSTIKARVEREKFDPAEILKSPWFNEYNPLHDVDFLSTSYEAGFEKPHPGIFEHAAGLSSVVLASKLEQTRKDWTPSLQTMWFKNSISERIKGIDDATFIHIGDDFSKDYEGALQAGWEPILLDRDGEHDEQTDVLKASNLGEAAAVVRLLADHRLQQN